MELVVVDLDAVRKVLREELSLFDGRLDSSPQAAGHFEWISNRDARSLLGLSKTTLQRYRQDGTLPYTLLGANVYYKKTDVNKILERNLRVGTSSEVAV